MVAAVLGLGLTTITSCKKILKEELVSEIVPANFYKTEADARAAVNSVYNELYTYDLYVQPMWNLTMLDDDHVSGADWFLGSAGAGNPQNYFGIDNPWIGYYKVIARANIVIENVGPMTGINEIIKNRILGEAYFLRGWSYFQLVQLYGKVPLRLKSLTADKNADIPRASIKEVYDVIISDLKMASTNLVAPNDANVGEVGRVNKAVSESFLAKVYLTIGSASAPATTVRVRSGNINETVDYPHTKEVVAGYNVFNSQEYFALARAKALEVIDTYKSLYPLYTSWTDLWKKDNRNKGEHMWMLQSLEGTAFTNQMHTYFSARSLFGTGAVYMTNSHYNDYEDQDLRILNGVVHNYTANNTAQTKYYYPRRDATKYQVVNGVTYTNNGTTNEKAYIIKYSDVTSPLLGVSDAHFPFLRFSELYLIYAEADNEINGPTGSPAPLTALAAINTIRGRAMATNVPSTITKEGLRDFVLAERAREFALETGIRHFDLLRWGLYLSVMNKVTAPQDNINKKRVLRNLLLPIPLSEMSTNKLIGGNNPGW